MQWPIPCYVLVKYHGLVDPSHYHEHIAQTEEIGGRADARYCPLSAYVSLSIFSGSLSAFDSRIMFEGAEPE